MQTTTVSSAPARVTDPVQCGVRHRRNSRLPIRIPVVCERPDARVAELTQLLQEGEAPQPSDADRLPPRYRDTTPLGREIIRKKLHAFKKRLRQFEQDFWIQLKRMSQFLPPDSVRFPDGQKPQAELEAS